MTKISSYEEISKLIFSFLKKGVLTNVFMSKNEFEREILNGSLYCFTTKAGLWIIREREEHYILNYYLTDVLSKDAAEETLNAFVQKLNKTVVVEVVGKTESDNKFIDACQFFLNIGANVYLERERYAKKISDAVINAQSVGNVEKDCVKIEVCEECDADRIATIFEENFDKLSGCIPNRKTIIDDIGNQNLYKATKEGKILGILHIKKDVNNSEIRHLAVAEEARNKGVASKVLEYYDKNVISKNKTVWTGKENIIAQKVYEKNGYQKDGYISRVFRLQTYKKVI